MRDGYPDRMSESEKALLSKGNPPGVYAYVNGDVRGRTVAYMTGVLLLDFDYFLVGNSILDVGCGNGRLWPMLSARFAEVVGIDPNLSPAWKMPDLRCCSWHKTDLVGFQPDRKFDVVLFNEVFYLLPDKRAVMDKVLALTDGSIFLVEDAKRTEEEIGEAMFSTNLYYDIGHLCRIFGLEVAADKTYYDTNTRVTVLRKNA